MSQPPFSTSIDDLDTMFCAVKARLKGIGDGAVEPSTTTAVEANERLRTGVLECVSALEQLHVMLVDEVERRRLRSLFVDETRAAPTSVPPGLASESCVPLRRAQVERLFTHPTNSVFAS